MVRLLLGLDETGCPVPIDGGQPDDVLILGENGYPIWIPIADVTDDTYLSSVSFVGDSLRLTMSEGTVHSADFSSFRVSQSSLPITGSGAPGNPLGLLVSTDPGNTLRLGVDNGLLSNINEIAAALTGIGFSGSGGGGTSTHAPATGGDGISVSAGQVVSLLSHDIISKHTVSGAAMQVVGLTGSNALGLLTPNSAPGASSAILKSDASGYLSLEKITTPQLTAAASLLIDPVGDLTINPGGGDLFIPGAVTLRSSAWTPGVLGTGWGLQERASGKSHLDIRSIYTDELIAAAFTADNVRVRAGSDWLGESLALATRDNSDVKTVIPTVGNTVTIYVEDAPQVAGRIFDDGEHVLIKSISRAGGGLTVSELWGTVTGYAVQPNNRQSYTWTTTSGTGNFTLEPGTALTGFGVSAGSYIYRSVIEAGRGPLERFGTWTTNPYTPSNRLSRVEIGDLKNAIGDSATRYGIAGGNNLALTPATGFSGFQANSVDGMKLYSVDIDLYNGGTQTVHIGKAGNDVWLGPSSADRHLSWNGTVLNIKGAITIQAGSTGIGTFSEAGDLATADAVVWPTQVTGGAAVNTAISTAQTTANNAASAASAAQSSANTANAALADIASDSLLTPDEKPRIIQDKSVIDAEQNGIDLQATLYSITTEKTAYDTAVSALTTYLATLTTPVLWNNLAGNTTIVGTTFRTKFSDVYTTRQALLNKITDRAKTLVDTAQAAANAAQSAANAAQSSANTANTAISNIASDSILSPGEKPAIVLDYDTIIAEQTGIDARATAYGITTEKTNYDAAITALTSYLGTIPGWNTIPGSDVAIVGTTFRTKFKDVYTTRQILLNKIAEIAGQRATWANVSTSAPADLTDGRIGLGLNAVTGTVKQYIRTSDLSSIIPPTEGLNLISDRFGYYNASEAAWKVWISSTGQFYFGGSTGAHLEWDGEWLKGVNSSNVVQWQAGSADGRIYAGAQNVMLSQYGLDLVAYSDSDPNPTSNLNSVSFWATGTGPEMGGKPVSRFWGGYVTAGGQYVAQIDVFHPTSVETYPRLYMSFNDLSQPKRVGYWGVLDQLEVAATGIYLQGNTWLNGTTTARAVTPEVSITYDLGAAGVKWRKLYVQDVIADNISGTAMSGATWRNDAGDMYIYSSSVGTRTLYIANDGVGVMNLSVDGSISVGGSVDGVDVSSFYTAYGLHVADTSIHHARQHSLSSASDHTGSLAWASVDKAGSSLADLTTRSHASLTSVGANDHHNQAHALIGGDHTVPVLTAGHYMRASDVGTYGFAAILDADIPATLVRTSRTLTGGDGINTIGDLGANRTISVKAHTLISVTASGVAVTSGSSLYQVIATGANPYPPTWTGLSTFAGDTTEFVGGKFAVRLATVSGLSGGAGGLEVADSLAGNGLQIASKVISVKPSTLISVAAGGVSLSVGTAQYQVITTGATPFTPAYTLLSDFAGDGLQFTGGAFAVHLDSPSGLQISSDKLALADSIAGDGLTITGKVLAIGTPGTLSATSTSSLTADAHNHAITANDAPTGVAILKSNASGGLTLTSLSTPSITSTTDLTLNSGAAYSIILNVSGANTASVNSSRIIPAGSGVKHLGDYNRKWGDIWASNFVVDVLVANEIMATIGGDLLVTPTTTLIEDFPIGAVVVKVKHQIPTASGTFMRMNGLSGSTPKAEIIKLTSGASEVTGGWSYTCQRNASGSVSGEQNWLIGDGLASIGASSGHGWIEMVSFQTPNYGLTQYGPTMTIYNRFGSGWSDVKPVGAFGNLRSLVDYVSDTDRVGVAIGQDLTQPAPSFSGITVDATSGLRLFNTDFRVYDSGSEVIFLGREDGLRFTPPIGEPGIGYYLNAIDWWDSTYGKRMISIDAYRSSATVYSRYSVDAITMGKDALAAFSVISDASNSATTTISVKSGAVTTSSITLQTWSSSGYGGVSINAYKRDMGTGNTVAGDIDLNGNLNLYGIGTSHVFAGNTSFATSYTYTFNGQLVSNTMRDINSTTKIKLALGMDVRDGADDAYLPINAKNIWLSDLNQTLGTHTIWTSGNDGSGTGLDADLVDGQHASAFWQASNDGTGSGLDADLLDGYHASNFIGKNGNIYYQIGTWLQWSGNEGIYFPNSGAGTHFYPNPDYYGAFKIIGSKGGYAGLHFESGYLRPLLMFSVGADTHGFWLQDIGHWTLRYGGGSWYCDEDLMWDDGNAPGRAIAITGAWDFGSNAAVWTGHGFRNTYDGVNVYDHYFPSGTTVDTTANLRVNKASGGYRTLVFSGNDTFQWDGRTVYHSGNFNPANYAPLGGATFTGNVGIGSSPSYAFQVLKSAPNDIVALFRNTSATGYGVKVLAGDDNRYSLYIMNAADSAGRHVFYGTGHAYLSLGGGALGVGTDSPVAGVKMQVAGETRIYTSVVTDNGLSIYMPSGVTSGYALRIDHAGTMRGRWTATTGENTLEINPTTDASAVGPRLIIQRNNNGAGKPGCLVLASKSGALYYLWVDTSNRLRIHTSQPDASDTVGSVVGTQS